MSSRGCLLSDKDDVGFVLPCDNAIRGSEWLAYGGHVIVGDRRLALCQVAQAVQRVQRSYSRSLCESFLRRWSRHLTLVTLSPCVYVFIVFVEADIVGRLFVFVCMCQKAIGFQMWNNVKHIGFCVMPPCFYNFSLIWNTLLEI